MSPYEELQAALNQLEAISFRLTQLAEDIGCLVLQLDRLFAELPKAAATSAGCDYSAGKTS